MVKSSKRRWSGASQCRMSETVGSSGVGWVKGVSLSLVSNRRRKAYRIRVNHQDHETLVWVAVRKAGVDDRRFRRYLDTQLGTRDDGAAIVGDSQAQVRTWGVVGRDLHHLGRSEGGESRESERLGRCHCDGIGRVATKVVYSNVAKRGMVQTRRECVKIQAVALYSFLLGS